MWGRGGWWDFGGVCQKKNGFHGGDPKNIRKRGGHVRYFSKTLKWHNVFIFKKVTDKNLLQTFLTAFLLFDFLRFSFFLLLLLMCCLCMPLNMLL